MRNSGGEGRLKKSDMKKIQRTIKEKVEKEV